MSTLSAFPFLGEQSFATPGAFNSPLSIISANIAAINADIGGFSGVTITPPSGNTITVASNLSVTGQVQVASLQADGPIRVAVPSGLTNYLYLSDASNLRSNYIIGSEVGSTADGLNIWDDSGQTMIVSFSKQSVRFYQQVVGPVFDIGGALSDTLNAATFGTGSDSTESRIQAGINAASLGGISRVYVPASMYPYSASSVSFIYPVQMVREGGNWAVFDVLAYGAHGNGIADDTRALREAVMSAPNGGVVYLPSKNTYKINSTVSIRGKREFTVTGGGTIQFSGITAIRVADDGTNDSYNVLISQLVFNGSNHSNSVGIWVTNEVHDVAQTHIRDCSMVSSPIAIHTTVGNGSGPHEVYVEDCIFSIANMSNSTGIWFQSGDNSILNTVVRGYDIGIKLESGSHQLMGNHLYLFPGTSHKRDIQCEAARCSLVNNFFDGACSQAYLSLSAFYARGTSVTGNLWLSTATAGPCVLFEQPGVPSTAISDFVITGNVFHANAAKTNPVSIDTYVVSHTGARVYIESNAFPYGIVTPFGTDPQIRQIATFATPNFDPDLSRGRTVELTLTGDTQIRGPVSNSLGLFQGSIVKFVFIQDATGGRRVTWNSDWKQAWSDAGNVATKRSSIVFQYNTAAVWEQVGAQSPYV